MNKIIYLTFGFTKRWPFAIFVGSIQRVFCCSFWPFLNNNNICFIKIIDFQKILSFLFLFLAIF